jgi:iron-sulfur cluster repair protein YtfE (RIC family)
MTHECRCSEKVPVAAGQCLSPVRAEESVGDVAQHRPGALETMKAMGINHCCGARLTLQEAAAAADVSLDALLAALNEPPEAPA